MHFPGWLLFPCWHVAEVGQIWSDKFKAYVRCAYYWRGMAGDGSTSRIAVPANDP